MYIYVGKLTWLSYAINDCITIVFPAGFALKDPVCAYWQWTVTANGIEKHNVALETFISSVTKTNSEYRLRFDFGHYAFEGTVSTGFKSLSLTMLNPSGNTATVPLLLQHGDPVRVPSTSVFTGKLNWFQYSQDEMVTLVIPGDVADGEPVVLIHQWTRNAAGVDKANHIVKGTMTAVNIASNGNLSARFTDNNGYYTYDFTVRKSRASDNIVLSMTNPTGQRDSSAPYNLKQTDFRDLRKKKALIMRFGTGTDNGIFNVEKMLVDHLGFAKADVELSYFDIDPDTGPKQSTLGQDPPTAANFRSKFTQLCHSAVFGDVRFLYMDAHGTTYPDDDNSGEPDGQDEGWILAENNDGTRKEVVSDDWLGGAIRTNLAQGVNLTILTPSCMGGGMLDTHTATPGILLAGCHETQFNVKALNRMDPWTVGITSVIKKNIRRKRGVPTYSVLYNEAKSFVRAQLIEGRLNERYKGPSPREWQPIPRHQETNTSNQDPQLVFYNGYVDPEEERFLFPFEAANRGHEGGDVTRFPKDEYPRDEL